MSRLPKPGSDSGSWGTILNDFLSVELNSDGTLKKASAITNAATKADNAQQAVDTLSSTVGAKLDKSIATTKGDLLAATASATIARVGVGTDGQVLTADGASTTGIKWTTPTASASSIAQTLAQVRRSGAALPLPPVGTRTIWCNALSNGTDTGQNTFAQHFLPAGITEVRFVYANSYLPSEVPGTDTLPIRVGCGLPDATGLAVGTIYPVFFRGTRAGSVAPSSILVSDPIALGVAQTSTPPTWVQSRTNIAVTAGQKWPVGAPDNISGRVVEGSEKGTSITDKSLTGTIASPGSTGVLMYGPCAVIGRPAGGVWTLLPAIGAVGDSILYGQGDGNFPVGGRGFFERAVNNAVGFCNLGEPAETIAAFLSGSVNRMTLLQGMTAIFAQHVRNDIAGGATFNTVRGLLVTYWTRLAATGSSVYQSTSTPTSTSSDSYQTAAGQTTDATNAIRVQVNDWIRDGGPILAGVYQATGSSAPGTLRAGAIGHPLTGYFDIADAVETSRNSGIWAVDPNVRTVTDAVMTSSSINLTSTTAGFTAGDVNKRVRVTGAGAAGAVLVAVITQYVNPTLVGLSAVANTTVSGATASWFLQPTSDGIHPGSFAAILASSAVNMSALTTLPTR